MITDTNTRNHSKFMWQGLYLDALRGMDSTGLLTVDKNGEITITKKAMAAGDFLQLKSVDDQIDDYANRVFIGHNRAATRGAVNNQNAHPFQHGNISMVHNGSLNHFNNLPDHQRFTVDSEAIAYSINKIGAEETLKLLQGAFALVWWDDAEKRLKMARNDHRPLHLASVDGDNTVIWGSEERMLHYVAGRAGLKLEDMWELPVKTIASFDPESKNMWECETQEVEYHSYAVNTAGFRKYEPAWVKKGAEGGTETAQKDKEAREKARKETEKKIKEREVVSNKMFKALGLEKDQRVKVFLYDFKPFNQQYPETGIWEGCTSDEPYTTVVIYGCRSNEFTIGREYTGKCLSMQIIDSKQNKEHFENYRVVLGNRTMESFCEPDGDKKEKKSKEVIVLPAKKKKATTSGDTREFKKKTLSHGFNSHGDYVSDGSGRDDTETADVDFLYLLGPNGVAISNKQWGELTKHGCGMCARDIPMEDSKLIEWWGEPKSPVCTHCLDECAGNETARLEAAKKLH